jgi:hypothetical protein
MALIIKIAEFIAPIREALNEALEARHAARRKYPLMSVE